MFQGKYDQAEPLYKRSLAIDEKVYGPDHPEVATDLNNWAGLLEAQVRAKRCFQMLLEGNLERNVFSQFLIGLVLNNDPATPSTVFQGKYEEADPLYLRAVAIGEKTLGPDHPTLATTLNNRAGLLSICSSALKYLLALTTLLPVVPFLHVSGQVRPSRAFIQALAGYR